MRVLISGLLILSVLGCKSKQFSKNKTIPEKSKIHIIKNYNESTECTFEVFKNASLQPSIASGYMKPDILKGENYVVVYQYAEEAPRNTADGGYKEMLYFEIPREIKEAFITNKSLKEYNVMYGRFCYCKDGGTGYFPVDNGKLKLKRANDTLYIDFQFKVGKIPQKITEVKAAITL